MIQDIAPHKLNNAFIQGKSAMSGDRVFVFDGNSVLIRGQELPTVSQIGDGECHYLFEMDGTDYYRLSHVDNIPEGFSFVKLYELRSSGVMPREMMFAMYTAHHLDVWYKDNVFCGRCGSRTSRSANERAMICPDCGNTIYPRINPAVIVGVRNKDRILVTKYANRANVPYYALVAGFTEIGETFEETVQREVYEEVGLKVKNITYYKSQPWGPAADILTGYFCEVDGDDTIRMDDKELKVAIWATRDEIELQPDDYSLTNEMMTVFKTSSQCSDSVSREAT